MAHRITINEKRLTRKQVQDIIKTEGVIHEEYTQRFEEKLANGRIKQDKIYELPGDRFLYAYDEKWVFIPGKGDIYSKEYFLKLVQRNQRIEQDTIYKRLSSVDHWRFYSKHKNEITDHIEPLVAELSAKSGISQKNLDTTYESLDLVSAICQRYDPEVLYQELYDNLVAYTGEVIRKRVYGNWAINENFSGGKYPYISIGFKNIQYMPINAVWTAITGLDPIDLRKEAANEVRLNASKAKFERLKIQMNDPAYPEN